MYEFVGSSLIPSHILANNEEINRQYENLALAFIPSENRAEHSRNKPFALVDIYGQFVVKELTEAEASNLGFLLQWLWENDSKRHDARDLFDKFKAKEYAANKERDAKIKEDLHADLDVINTMAKSNLHTYKLPDGRKIG